MELEEELGEGGGEKRESHHNAHARPIVIVRSASQQL